MRFWRFFAELLIEKIERKLIHILRAIRTTATFDFVAVRKNAQQFLFVLIIEKGKLTGLTEQDKKRDFAVLTRTCRAACYLHHAGAMPRITGFIFWISAVPTSAVRAACQCAPSFRAFPRHRCCGLIASFPGPCASSGGRLPESAFN